MAKEKRAAELQKIDVSKDASSKAHVEKETCGLIMPMSPMDGFSPVHWAEVKQILDSAITRAGYEPRIVSTAKEAGVIQKRIVRNLYELPIVVCDISGRNANVMLELGLRFAFDKLVVVVKDDLTPAPFDVSAMEWVEYPRSLRHAAILQFQAKLRHKILQTVAGGIEHTFLKSFGTFKIASPEVEKVSASELRLDRMEEALDSMRRTMEMAVSPAVAPSPSEPYSPKPLPGLSSKMKRDLDAFMSAMGRSYPKQMPEVETFVRDFAAWLRTQSKLWSKNAFIRLRDYLQTLIWNSNPSVFE